MYLSTVRVSIILIRYSEIGLKSKTVRRRFEARLKDNMMTMFLKDGIEALVESDGSRFYVTASDTDGAVRSLKRVFGIASMSVAEKCGSDIDEICGTVSAYSVSRIGKGQSFAVRARRDGTHPYNSMELGKEAGSAIFRANEGLKVDLTDPDVTFYIEVRNNKAFIFDSYIRAHAGLPLGSQGKVAAYVNDDRGLLSAWMMMKRGCRAIVHGDYDTDVLKAFDPDLKVMTGRYRRGILGVVLGTSVDGLDAVDVSEHTVPVYFPTIGMSDDEVRSMLSVIRSEV